MITKVDILAAQGGTLTLTPDDDVSGLVTRDIGGTDPVKATIVSSSFAQQDGTQFQSIKREARDLTFKIGLDPDWVTETVLSLRRRLQGIFMTKSLVQMTFLMSDGLNVVISGRVETNESAMFTDDPVVDISVHCDEPDFIDPDPVVQNGVSTSGSTSINFPYQGSVETGVLFKMQVDRDVDAFTIYHIASDGTPQKMDFAADLIADDVLTISTVDGSKYATLTRLGVDSSILYGVDPTSSWFELTPGSNDIRVYATGDPVPYTIQYFNRYGAL